MSLEDSLKNLIPNFCATISLSYPIVKLTFYGKIGLSPISFFSIVLVVVFPTNNYTKGKTMSIREKRKLLKLSQAQLAKLCRLSQAYISALEAGYVQNPDEDVLSKIDKILNELEEKNNIVQQEESCNQ
jgi:hypothetical protein